MSVVCSSTNPSSMSLLPTKITKQSMSLLPTKITKHRYCRWTSIYQI